MGGHFGKSFADQRHAAPMREATMCRPISLAALAFCLTRLQLGEQPHVLDGDDGLVGKGLKQ